MLVIIKMGLFIVAGIDLLLDIIIDLWKNVIFFNKTRP